MSLFSRSSGSSRRSRRDGAPLADRLDALARAADALAPVAPGGDVSAAQEVVGRIDRRRALSAEHTVVGLFGATGSGKSSLLNALVGQEVTRAAVRRPTTSAPVAAVFGGAGSDPLLDWLEVEDRHHLPGDSGLVLLDLPDLDSVELGNRAIAERLTGLVDVLVWVTDPQKYADAVLHQDFVQPFAGHDAVTVLVLNQIDRIRSAEREGVLASLEQLARRDGLERAPVLGVSAETGEGIEPLRDLLTEVASGREAVASRHRADVRAAAESLRSAADPAGLPARSAEAQVSELVDDLAVAARVEPVASAVGGSYRHRAAGRVGWPPVRWLRRFRADPLARLGLGRERADEQVHRSSLPEADPATRARAAGGVRRFADAASAGGTDPWRAAIRTAARSREDELPDALDQAVAGADLRSREASWWWPVLDVLQWLALLTAVVGLGWLAANAALAFAGIPPLPLPMLEGLWIPVPLPTALIVLGLAAGLLLGLLGTALAALAAAARTRRARRLLRERVAEVADSLVVREVDEELRLAAGAATDLALAHGE
ncbi:GTPase [Brachybacterium sp. J144]|uniref:GTPase n=1 Tax=Brachybacterium sp. J144 TaxID=3116487 RepID=UPI002E776933|nr:GTPase [Brachybacterium sp. J144]MEE1651865.1 GTPase [Brachybacterium sp. J144]